MTALTLALVAKIKKIQADAEVQTTEIRHKICETEGWSKDCYVWQPHANGRRQNFICWTDENSNVVTRRINKKIATFLIEEAGFNSGD
jgi:hypothetical protein